MNACAQVQQLAGPAFAVLALFDQSAYDRSLVVRAYNFPSMISLSTWRSICASVYIFSRRAYFAFNSLNSLSWLASRPLYLAFHW